MNLGPVVLGNVHRFQKNVKNVSHFGQETLYTVFLNCRTGDMLFSRHKDKSGVWKEVFLISHRKNLQFELRDAAKGNVTGLDGQAERVVKQTLAVLGQKSLDDSSLISRVQEDFPLLPGWVGELSLAEAKKVLQGSILGSCVIRACDEVARIAAEQWEDVYPGLGACLLTFVAEEGRILERLILHTRQGWMVCEDKAEPKFYLTIEELFSKFSLTPK